MAKELEHSKEFKETYNPAYRAARGLSATLSRADSVLMNRRADVTILTETEWQLASSINDRYSQMIGSQKNRHGRRTIILPDMAKGVSNDPVVTTLGYNYHAVGHSKFSPNSRKVFDTFTASPNIDLAKVAKKYTFGSTSMDLTGCSKNVYNVFECARIERLMIAAFPSTRSYFASATYNKIGSILDSDLSGSEFSKEARLLAVYMYLALRPYLAKPLRMRALDDLRQATGIQIDDDAIRQVLDDYLTLTFDRKIDMPAKWVRDNVAHTYGELLRVFPKDSALALYLFRAFMHGMMATCDSTTNGDDHDPGSEDQQSLQRVAQQTQKDDDQDDQDDQGDQGGGQGDEEGDEESQEGQGGDGEGEGEDGDAQDSKDGQNDSDSDSESESNGRQAGSGKGDDPKNDDTPPPLKDMLEQASSEASESAMDNESSRREVEDLRQNMSLSGTYSPKVEGTKHTPSSDYVLMQKQMAREFGKIMEDADPGFLTHQPSGRVSMKRAMHGIDDYDTAFDMWDEGKLSAASMELVVLIDNSGSMSRNMTEACQSAWAISRGVESLGDSARVSTLFFNSDCFLSKRASEKETAQYTFHRSTGGTDPTTALVDAARILTESSRAHRLCVILTDGAWSGTPAEGQNHSYSGLESNSTTDAELVIRKMQAKGVQVSIANMFDTDEYERYVNQMNLSHGADIVKHITQPKDFVAFARSIVKEAMTK